ncbi:MAG: hypothetical protein AB7O45_11065 [Alphaproteobacteria bacterium]
MPFDAIERPAPLSSLLESLCRLPGSMILGRGGRYDHDAQRWVEPEDNVPPPKGMEKPPKDFDEVIRAFPVVGRAR